MNRKISVIMAVYNCEKTITSAINSILNQTYQNWVAIICDDGSNDNTFKILEDFKSKFPDKFILIRNDQNKKLPFCLNRCLEQVQTEIIARMDGDDISHPERFEIQLKYLTEHPEVKLVGTGVSVSDGSRKIGTIIKHKYPTKLTMTKQNAFSHATIMTYKDVYDKLGGYSLDPSVERVEDVDLWCRFFSEGFIGHNIPDELYTILENDESAKRRTLKARYNEAKTKSSGYKMMGFSGWVRIKPYFGILKSFVPMKIYRFIHKIRLKNSFS